jgi:hypothetical protein
MITGKSITDRGIAAGQWQARCAARAALSLAEMCPAHHGGGTPGRGMSVVLAGRHWGNVEGERAVMPGGVLIKPSYH